MKVAHFITKSPAVTGDYITFIEKIFPDVDNRFYIVDRRGEYKKITSQNEVHLRTYTEILSKNFLLSLEECKKIFVSGIFSYVYFLPLLPKRILKKCYLQFWGGDYVFLREKGMMRSFRKKLLKYCIDNCHSILVLTEGEIGEIKKLMHGIKKDIYVLPMGVDEDTNQVYTLEKFRTNPAPKEEIRILVGNSASRSGHHNETFEKLMNLNLKGAKVYCPLSYGDMDYKDIVLKKGKTLFKDAFVPITEYMPYNDYISFLSTCDVGVFNMDRQQAMGNIDALLYLGKKVYMDSTASMYLKYSKNGIKVFDVNEIENQTMSDFLRWDREDAYKNYISMITMWNKVKDRWQEIYYE